MPEAERSVPVGGLMLNEVLTIFGKAPSFSSRRVPSLFNVITLGCGSGETILGGLLITAGPTLENTNAAYFAQIRSRNFMFE